MKYKQVYEVIRQSILSGEYKLGDRLPSVREAVELHGYNKATILSAYNKLTQDGYIYSASRSGYYVSEVKRALAPVKALYDFSSASPEYDAVPFKDLTQCLNSALVKYEEKVFQYIDPRGLEHTIEAVRKQLQDHQVFAKAENIVMTSGSQQAVDLLLRMEFPKGGGKILVEQPVYQGVLHAARINGAEVIGIERTQKGIDLNYLESILRSESIRFIYLIPRFQNPLSTSLSLKQKEDLLKLAKKYCVYIIEDDYLADFGQSVKNPPMYYLDDGSTVIYLKSYSKVFLPGLRLAAIVLPDLLVNPFIQVKRWTDLGSNVLGQGALEVYLNSGMFKRHLTKTRKVYQRRMDALESTLLKIDYNESIREFSIEKGNVFASVRFKRAVNYDRLLSRLQDENITISDGRTYFMPHFNQNDFARLSIIRASEASIANGLPKFFSILNEEVQKGYIINRTQY